MSEFVGRAAGTNRRYSYPETNRFRNLSGPFANNFAYGPGFNGQAILADATTQANWIFIESSGGSGVHVPITPKSSGRIRITSVLTVACQSEGSVELQIRAQLDDATLPIPGTETVLVPNGSAIAIPFLLDVSGLAIGVTRNVSLLLIAVDIADALTLVGQSSTIDVQEIGPATG